MRTTFAVGKTDRKSTEVLMVGGSNGSEAAQRSERTFARSSAGASPFPGPWTVTAMTRSPRSRTEPRLRLG